MNNLLSKNKLVQKTNRLTAETKVNHQVPYKLPDKTHLLNSPANDTQIHSLDFAKCFETLKEQMKYHDKTHFI